MCSVNNAVALLAFLTFQGVHAALNVTSASNVAVYWGQNSYGDSSGDLAQQSLAYYCSDIDVIQLAFLDVINGEGGAPEINFANSGDSCTTFDGTALLNCPTITEDIVTCQTLGKTILLSIGGATYSEGGFISDAAAIAGAKLIWETFGPVSTNTSINRPFGDSVVDGFDFDFESTVDSMPAFANKLRNLFAEDTSKTYYLTAAPQCVYPDAADSPMLDGAVYFDAIWVQFYNNHCGVNYYTAGSTTQTNFNFDSWNTWATTISLNPDVKVFLGIPGGSTAAGTGYESPSTIASIVDFIVDEGYTSFGGIMMWDVSQVYANDGFLSSIISDLRCFSTTRATILSTVTTTENSTTSSLTSTTVPTTLSTVQNTRTVTIKSHKNESFYDHSQCRGSSLDYFDRFNYHFCACYQYCCFISSGCAL
ncbi:class III chitinase [Penicillium sp. IBT 16267x]|nr:class III chitinase [Penicillium sp. IBT 16267x]